MTSAVHHSTVNGRLRSESRRVPNDGNGGGGSNTDGLLMRNGSAKQQQHPYDSSDAEPWDERKPASSKNPLLACVDDLLPSSSDQSELDDGELPSLRLTGSHGGSSTTRRRTKPLQPPSRKGMASPERPANPTQSHRSQFWSQLELTPQRGLRGEEDDAPMDEMASRASGEQGAGDPADVPLQRHPSWATGTATAHYEMIVEEAPSAPAAATAASADLCANLDEMMSQVCGDGNSHSSPERTAYYHPSQSRVLKSVEELSGEVSEEQTAIEVEYVDPEASTNEDRANWSPNRKHQYLAAMARRAKQEYQEQQENNDVGPSGKSPTTGYDTLTAEEKRRFLKHINSGMSPTEATNRVVDERKQETAPRGTTIPQEGDVTEQLRDDNNGEDDKSSGAAVVAGATVAGAAAAAVAASHRSPTDESPSNNSKSTNRSAVSSPASTPKKSMGPLKKFWKKTKKAAEGIEPKNSNNKGGGSGALMMMKKKKRRAVAIPEEKKGHEGDELDMEADERTTTMDVTAPREADNEKDQDEENEAGTAGVGAASLSMAPSDSSDAYAADYESDAAISAEQLVVARPRTPPSNRQQVGDEFPSAGNNYYDAVRRKDIPEDESTVPTPQGSGGNNSNNSRSGRLAAIRPPRLQGFNQLDEDDEGKQQEQPQDGPKALPQQEQRRKFLGVVPIPERQNKPAGFQELEDDGGGSGVAAGAAVMGAAAAVGVGAAAASAGDVEEGKKRKKEIPNTPLSMASVQQLSPIQETGNPTEDEEEEKTIEQLEKKLLRPMAAAADAEDEPIASHSVDFDLKTPKNPTPRSQQQVEVSAIDTSLSNYLDSTSVYSGVTRDTDHMSVVSGRSHWTAASSVTTSSRKRRPGAAKSRLAKAKQANASQTKGWHQSIKMAATKSNQTWDPYEGFVDFKDPTPEMVDAYADEKIRLNLNVRPGRQTQKQEGSNQRENLTPVLPFPKEWEEERSEMLSMSGDQQEEARIASFESKSVAAVSTLGSSFESEMPSIEEEAEPKEAEQRGLPNTASSNQVWLDSMQAASAKLGRGAPKWHPEKGWQHTGANEDSLDPVIREEDLEDQEGYNEQEDEDEVGDVEMEEEEDVSAPDPDGFSGGVLGAVAATAVGATAANLSRSSDPDGDTLERQPARQSRGVDIVPNQDEELVEPPQVVRSSDPALDDNNSAPLRRWMAGALPEKHATPLTEGSDLTAIARSSAEDNYMQLGDTGSVKAYPVQSGDDPPGKEIDRASSASAQSALILDRHLEEDDETTENDNAPLLNSELDSQHPATPNSVNVIKKKVSEDDMNLFAHDSNANVKTIVSNTTESSPTRRGPGPIDVDEIDDMDFSDTDSEDNVMLPDSYMQGNVSSALLQTTTSAKQPAESSSAFVVATKALPKLRAPARDTSPIRRNRSVQSVPIRPEPVLMKNFDSSAPGNSEPKTGDFLRPKKEPEANVARDADDSSSRILTTKSSASEASSVRLRAQQWEIMNSPKHDDRSRRPPTPEQDRPRLYNSASSRRSPPKPEVTDRAEGRQDGTKETIEAPAGTEEWRSFLGKKVRAESAAAARKETQRVDIPPPRSPNPKYVGSASARTRDDDRDSLFDFKSSAGSAISKSRSADGIPIPVSDKVVSSAKQSFRERSDERRGKNYGQPHYVDNGDDRRGASYGQPSSNYDENTVDDNLSNISPIPIEESNFDTDTMERASDSGTAVEQGSFLKRLQACAAPIIPKGFLSSDGDQVPKASSSSDDLQDSVPSAHLEFLKANPGGTVQNKPKSSAQRQVPPSLLGRPDTIAEDDGELGSPYTPKQRPSSNGRSSSSKRRRERSSKESGENRSTVSLSSSDGFGARTSYLEAIAMKAAVSKPKRSGSRGRGDEKSRSSSRSDVSTGSRQPSEKWQEFLDRKAAGVSPVKTRSEKSDASAAAEKYAAEKVAEMMEVMAADPKSKSHIDDMIETHSDLQSPYEMMTTRSTGSKSRSTNSGSRARGGTSDRAAEELAAARVEAMMAAMTSTKHHEGEI